MTGNRRKAPARSAAASAAAAVALGLVLLSAATPAAAQRIENGTAVFAALDKVTARISKLEVKLGETVKFGALKVTPRACYTRPPTEPPKTTSFVEIQEAQLDGKESRIFNGWMFAESPGLNALEHPVFDVWLTDCTAPVRPVATGPQRGAPTAAPPGRGGQTGQQQPGAAPGADTGDGEAVEPRRRPRR